MVAVKSSLVANSTEVRNHWSEYTEEVVRDHPLFIKRLRDYLFMTNIEQLMVLLEAYNFSADYSYEDDGTIAISLNEIDLVLGAASLEEAKLVLGRDILEYAEDWIRQGWYNTKNRRKHLPYVLKALLINDAKKLGESIICQVGEA
jgi:hypothetical protein